MKTFKLLFVSALLASSTLSFAQPAPAVMQTDRQFYIQSAMDYGRDYGGYWDIPGSPQMIDKGSNIQVWDLDGGIDRKFTLVKSSEQGYYEMYVGDTKASRVDIENGSSKDGTNVKVWERNGATAQRFLFQHLGDGRFKIIDRNGKVVCLASRSNKNGSNVHIWGNHDGIWVEWYLIDAQTKKAFIPSQTQQVAEARLKGDAVPEGKDFWIQSAMSYGRNNDGCWDLPGTNGTAQNANIQIWTIDGGTDRFYRFEKKRDSEYYQIYAGQTSDGVVDLPGGKTENGNVMQIWKVIDRNPNQDFYLKHLGNGRFKIYHRSGKIVNLKNTDNKNGNKVQLWNDHDGIHCEWYLVDPQSKQAFIPGNSTTTATPAKSATAQNQTTTQTSNSSPSRSMVEVLKSDDQLIIETYFKSVTSSVIAQNSGVFSTVINELEPAKQANTTFYILNGLKNNHDFEAKKQTYNELLSVVYKKASFLLKAATTSYFNNYKENDAELKSKPSELHKKMTN